MDEQNGSIYAFKRIGAPKGRGKLMSVETLMSAEERLVYRLYHQTPGFSQPAIAKKLRKDQSQISRILKTASAKVAELKRLCELAGGDSDIVERYLDSENRTPKFRGSRA